MFVPVSLGRTLRSDARGKTNRRRMGYRQLGRFCLALESPQLLSWVPVFRDQVTKHFCCSLCVLQIQHKIRPGVPFDHQLRMVNRLCHPHHCHPSFSHLAKNSAVPCHRSYLESENLRQVPNMFRTLKKM